MSDHTEGRIAGYYILDNPTGGPDGDGTEHGWLFVEQRSDGWDDSERDVLISAFEIAPVKNVESVLKRLTTGEPIPFDEQTTISVL